jgi:hypothetical protein
MGLIKFLNTNTGAFGSNVGVGVSSIIGPTGPTGPNGPQGYGPTGNIGPTGHIGPQGDNGPQGLVGPQGPTGVGPTGHIGPQGFDGPQGLVGPQGPTGVGPTGHIGPQGFDGPQGLVGPQGVTGAHGHTGPTGSRGEQGYQGLIGPQGASFWNQTGSNIYYNSGSVAIGKVSASSTLDVVGSVSITGPTTFYGNLINPTFNAYKETIFISAFSGSFIVNCSTGNNFALTLQSGTNAISFTNFAPTGTLHGVNLFITQDGVGSRLATWPATVSWGTAGVPTLSTTANSIDIVNFITYTGGSKILGMLSGKGF